LRDENTKEGWVVSKWVIIKCMAQNNINMRRLTTGICSEKCVVRRFRCTNVIECSYTNLDNIAYYTPNVYFIVYSS